MLTMVAFFAWGCGGEKSASDEAVSFSKEVALTETESAAIEEEYSLEALETIDETNAESELKKLTAEIDADQ